MMDQATNNKLRTAETGDSMFRSGFATIIGRPNVGKSTLLNSLIGQKIVIMSDKPQTTRNKIQGVLTRKDAQIVFLDTPGIHKPRHRLGERLNEMAKSTLAEVEAILFVADAEAGLGVGDEYIIDELQGTKTPVFLVLNKIDRVDRQKIAELSATYLKLFPFREVVPISALTGENVPQLVEKIVAVLPEGPQYYPEDMITDQPEQFLVAEIVREKVLHLTRDEVPHSIAVVIEEMKPREGRKLVYIRAVIYCERESQKGILIGGGGGMLKEVGRLAREELEPILGTRIYLELWVKVKKDWRNREQLLREFGYGREN